MGEQSSAHRRNSISQAARADRERRLAGLLRSAISSDGIFSTGQASDWGFSRASLARLIASGLVERVAPRHLRSTSLAWSLEARHRQAVLRSGPLSMLGGTSALYTWNLLAAPRQIVVVGPRGVRGAGGQHRRVQSTDLIPSDAQLRRSLLVSTPPRAIIDAARDLSVDALHEVISTAVGRKLVSDATLRVRFLEVARRGRPGVARLRRVLAARRPGDDPEATFFEEQLERIIRSAGLPQPERQYRVRWKERTYYLDHAWPSLGVWSECDSVLAHASADALHRDLDRQNDIVLATGFQPVRFSYRHVMDHPTSVAATLTSLLQPAGHEHGPETTAER